VFNIAPMLMIIYVKCRLAELRFFIQLLCIVLAIMGYSLMNYLKG